jgi:CubicO group peptidase (beta-lactamase class C family)
MMRSTIVLPVLLGLVAACGGGGEETTGTVPGPAETPQTTDERPAPVLETTPRPATAVPLPRSTPEAEGVSSQLVLDFITQFNEQVHEPHSMMLLRHGKVIAEGWWAPYTPGDMHTMYSVTKSFNSTALGMAVEEGLLSVDDLVTSFFPEYPAPSPAFQTMTVKHLLTMSTGHAADTIDRMRTSAPDGGWVKAFFALDVENAPGSLFIYNSGAAYVLAAIVEKVTGMSVEEYLTPRLFDPLGIVNRLWGKSPENINLGDGGLAITTEELATFGQFYLQGGLWAGQQLVSPEWAAAATSKQVDSYTGNGNWSFGYGYQFWRSQLGYRADGSLGQFSFVMPEKDLVLALTSGTDNDGGTNRIMNVVFQYFRPAELGDALPENPAVHDALTAKLASLALAAPQGAPTSPLVADAGGRYTLDSNTQGITSVALDFPAGADPVVTFQTTDGFHAIPVGIGRWLRARTGFKKRINELFDTPDQAVSTMGAWTADNVFSVKLAFTETPYTEDVVFTFNAGAVTVDQTYNVRWGSKTEPQLLGHLDATPQ